ncbi:MAG: Fmu (Sun) domain-containing protein [Desulfovibrio sp.]|nr:Fmu (Sun) domain-containing protein [Desulfovibrio sp.]
MTRSAPTSTRTHRTQERPLRLYRADHDPRAAALTVLSRVMFARADSQAAIDDALRASSLVPTDKRLCTELVYGVLRRYLSLELFAESFLRKPDKLPMEMRLALLISLYEMLCLRIPHYASVGWAVAHVRNRFGQKMAGVANGALRAMQRSLGEFPDPRRAVRPEASEERLSRLFAMPLWIVRLWLQSYGMQSTLALLDAALNPPPAGLRLNRAHANWEQSKKEILQLYEPARIRLAGQKAATPTDMPAIPQPCNAAASPCLAAYLAQNEVSADETLFLADTCTLAFSGTLPWRARMLLKEGKASRQSAASCEALAAFAPDSWQLPIWDCCAGRGGKTLTLLEQGIAVAVASDQSERRLRALPEEYARLGLTHPPCPTVMPVSVEQASVCLDGQMFGTILVDAPCSGLGTLSRRPEIRFRRTHDDLETLTDTQKRILILAWRHVRAGGSLVYLTCTLNPAENQLQIADFLAKHGNATLIGAFQTDFSSPLREFFYGARIEKSLQEK